MSNTNLPTLEITWFPNDDGSASARLDAFNHDGAIYGSNIQTLMHGMIWLMEQLMQAELKRQEVNSNTGMLENGMQAAWIDGVLAVRWLPIPGFGVSFTSQENFVSWSAELLKIAIAAGVAKKEA